MGLLVSGCTIDLDLISRTGRELRSPDPFGYFPLQQRDRSRDPTADEFRPERWINDPAESRERYPNLFLRGPRTCPGEDLITFVCQSAIAALTGAGQRVAASTLAADPLPLSFPERELRFS